jgi:hemerythrin-like domain-containing protein
MAKLLEDLRRDHLNMRRVLGVLEQQSRELRNAQPIDFELLREIADYCVGYPDLFHHPSEDRVYSRLLVRGAPGLARLSKIQSEHQELAAMSQALARTVMALTLDEQLTRDSVVAAMDSYAQMLRRHMECEESSLFPLADLVLTEADWAELQAATREQTDPLEADQAQARYARLVEAIAFGAEKTIAGPPTSASGECVAGR